MNLNNEITNKIYFFPCAASSHALLRFGEKWHVAFLVHVQRGLSLGWRREGSWMESTKEERGFLLEGGPNVQEENGSEEDEVLHFDE